MLRVLFGLPLAAGHELELYQRCTGRTDPPMTPASEGWLVCGRRGGKSFTLALIAVYLACFLLGIYLLLRASRDWKAATRTCY